MAPRLDSSRFDLGPRPHLGYSASRIDRAAERRADADAMHALEGDSSARAYVIGGELVVLRKTEAKPDPLFSCALARGLAGAAETVFLGLVDGAPRFAVAIDPSAATALKADDAFEVTDLRSTRDVVGSSAHCAAKQGLLGPLWQRPELYDSIYPRPLREAAE